MLLIEKVKVIVHKITEIIIPITNKANKAIPLAVFPIIPTLIINGILSLSELELKA